MKFAVNCGKGQILRPQICHCGRENPRWQIHLLGAHWYCHKPKGLASASPVTSFPKTKQWNFLHVQAMASISFCMCIPCFSVRECPWGICDWPSSCTESAPSPVELPSQWSSTGFLASKYFLRYETKPRNMRRLSLSCDLGISWTALIFSLISGSALKPSALLMWLQCSTDVCGSLIFSLLSFKLWSVAPLCTSFSISSCLTQRSVPTISMSSVITNAPCPLASGPWFSENFPDISA